MNLDDLRTRSEALRREVKFNSHSSIGTSFIRFVVPHLIDRLDEVRTTGKGRKPLFVSLVSELDSAQIAIVCLVAALDNISQPVNKTTLSLRIGQFLLQELNYDSMLASNEGLFKGLTGKAISHRVRRTLDECVKNGDLKAAHAWTEQATIQVGASYLQCLLDIGVLDEYAVPTKTGSKSYRVTWSEMVTEWATDAVEGFVFNNPISLPLTVRPQPYDSEGFNHSYGESFPPIPFRLASSVFKTGANGDNIKAADALSQVAFTVHKGVFNVVHKLWNLGHAVGQLPRATRVEIPPYPGNEDEERLSDWKREASRIHIMNAVTNSKRVYTSRTITVAKDYIGKPMHFLYQADGRGRLYPVTSTLLNPQGSDISKGLLCFHTPKPIGKAGLYELYIAVAASYGKDKTSLSYQVDWTAQNLDMIRAVAESPVDSRDLWEGTDEPFQFLQACMELTAAIDYPEGPELYPSGFIRNLDGRCSGAQHYAGMTHHRGTAEQVGLVRSTPDSAPPDIYTAALIRFITLVNNSTDDDVLWWKDALNKGFATRSLAKRPTMTYLYTATIKAFASHIHDEAKAFGIEGELTTVEKEDGTSFKKGDLYKRSYVLAAVMMGAVEDTMKASAEAMEWIGQAAKAIIKTGDCSIRWTSPSGFEVTQEYFKQEFVEAPVRSKIFDKDIRISYLKDTAIPNKSKAKSALTANFVHSYDAAHLAKAVIRFNGDIRVIHDSFGVHLSEVDSLRSALKGTYIDMYSGNALCEQRQVWEEMYGVVLPAVPVQGDWSPVEMMDSVYDFS